MNGSVVTASEETDKIEKGIVVPQISILGCMITCYFSMEKGTNFLLRRAVTCSEHGVRFREYMLFCSFDTKFSNKIANFQINIAMFI